LSGKATELTFANLDFLLITCPSDLDNIDIELLCQLKRLGTGQPFSAIRFLSLCQNGVNQISTPVH